MKKIWIFNLPFILSLTCVLPVYSQTVYDESTSGDASSSASAPTSIALAEGNNSIIGSVTTSTGDTRDYFTFSVPAGHELTALNVVTYDDPGTGTANDGNTGFHALDEGATSVIPGAGTSSQLLGGDHVDGSKAGTNVLPAFAAAGTAGSGFSTPLGSGTYTYVIQQTGPNVSSYEVQFVLSAVGAPVAFSESVSGDASGDPNAPT